MKSAEKTGIANMHCGNGTLQAAIAYRIGGLSVIPIRHDGSKAPAIRWEEYQRRLPTEVEIEKWYQDQRLGVGVVGGQVSGHLEIIDFDAAAETNFPAWRELVEAEAPGVLSQLSIHKTPKPGFHVAYRCPDITIPGNTKLAIDGRETLIETRGEGGQVLAPGCPANCHPSGRLYEHFAGPLLSEVATITADERDVLLRCARSFDRSQASQPEPEPRQTKGSGNRPGDDYNRRGPSWADILEPTGWTEVHKRGDARYWRRPGKDGRGWSATTGVCENGEGFELLAVFSSNAHPFEGAAAGRPCSCYTKFSAYALLRHSGDYTAAAKDLAGQGYGDRDEAWREHGRESTNRIDDGRLARTIRHRAASTVETRAVSWLWPPRIARRAINLLDGDPGLGKSFVTLWLTAMVSRGRKLAPEDGPGGVKGDVILLNDEDDANTTIVPRLLGAGADLSRVHLVDGIMRGNDEEPLFLPGDLDLLEEIALETKAVLIVIDPFMAYIGDGVDSHKDSDIRRVMRRLKAMAERTEAAIVLVRHLNKASGVENAVYRGGGSIGIVGAARSALLVGKHPNEPEKRVMARTKGNLAADPDALVYSIEPETDNRGPAVTWHGSVDLSADDLVSRDRARKTEEASARKLNAVRARVLSQLDEYDSDREGVGLRALRERCPGIGATSINAACRALVDDGICQFVDIKVPRGNRGAMQAAQGIRRCSGSAD